MALQVWLPLTKDLRNQGINDTNIEAVTSAVFDNNGKLGKCLSEGKIKIPANKVASIFNNTSMSIAFWYNNNTSEAIGSHAICGFSGNSDGDSDAVRIWDFFNYNTPNNFHWSMGNLGGGSLTNVFPANTWVHVCVTWNAPTLKIYMDGVLKRTGSGSSNYTFDKSYYISFGRTPQKLNDFRIYDHCLTENEVKRLAQGLILHYPLNRNGWGQENLYNFRSYANSWIMEELDGVDYTDSSYGNVIKLTTSAENQRTYHGVNKVWQSGQVYTVSFLAKADTNGRTCDMSRSLVDFSPTFTLTTDWKRYSGKITSTVTSTGGTLSFRVNQSEATVYITQIKLEKGEIVTPYCPSERDPDYNVFGLDSTTEYDISGFCNNGTRTGTFSWTSDTPKYCVSTVFNGTDAKIIADTRLAFLNASPFTVSFWAYADDWSTITASGGKYIVSQYNATNGGFAIYSSSGVNRWRICWMDDTSTAISTYFSAADALTSGWYFFTAVYDGTKMRTYLNGEQYTSKSATFKVTSEAPYLSVSNGSSGMPGNLSDFRIYATALSADDVKSLYQNCATIGPDGTIYGEIRS